jgi:hypothetical protein
VLLGGIAVASVPGSVRQICLRLGGRLKSADGEKRVTSFLERVLASIVPRKVE